MGDLGIFEIILILIAGVILFGGDLPDVARKMGFYWGKLQVFVSDIKRQLDQEFQERERQKQIVQQSQSEDQPPPLDKQEKEVDRQKDRSSEEETSK